jgi:hypothetical protein
MTRALARRSWAGLLVKELRLRAVADRVLVLCPAPLTVQWQDELHEKFDEDFAIIDSHLVRWQLGRNPWEREDRCIASLDFAKREEIMPELLRVQGSTAGVTAGLHWDAAGGVVKSGGYWQEANSGAPVWFTPSA